MKAIHNRCALHHLAKSDVIGRLIYDFESNSQQIDRVGIKACDVIGRLIYDFESNSQLYYKCTVKEYDVIGRLTYDFESNSQRLQRF